MKPELWDIENALFAEGFRLVAGVDEAGRGPCAGDVYAAAVILPPGVFIEGLNDSKRVGEKLRERLYDEITAMAVSYSIASASVSEIAELNILGATYLAMNRAIEGLAATPDMTLIDGNQSKGILYANRCVVEGDSKSASIAAASILAKVTRDRYMQGLALEYPGYGFERHMGYGTKLHMDAILELGPTPVHRERFLRKLYAGHK